MKPAVLSTMFLLAWAFTGLFAQPAVQVSGVVRSARSGEPLKGARVSLLSRDQKQGITSTTAGGDGSFSIAGLPPGRYQVTVSKSGYHTYQGSGPVTIVADSTAVTTLTPSLWPYGAIGGRVIDWDGEPISRAEIRAYAIVYKGTGATLSLAAKADSDDTGEYRLFDLPAGKYVLHVSPPRGGTPSGQFYADTPAVYYPAALSPAQALPVELSWGEDVARADVRLSRGRSYAISGAVWDASMEGPCPRCLVQAVQHDNVYSVGLPQTARVSPDGAFVLRGLSSGDYILVARHGNAVAETRVSVLDGHVGDARLTVGLQQPVTGEIFLEAAPEGIDATDWVPALVPVALPDSWPRVEGRISGNRQFTFAGVPPATYRFEVEGLPPGAYLKAIRVGRQPLETSEVRVSSESGISGLQVVIGFDSATVRGRVRPSGTTQSAQFVDARVFLIPRQGQTGLQFPKTTETASDGSFSLVSIPPGSYTLYALPATTSLQVFDPAVQSTLARYARQVGLEAKATEDVELTVAPAP